MSSLAALTARQLTEVARETHALSGPALRRASFTVAVALLVVTGIGFLLLAAHAALTRSLGVEAAGLIVGASLLISAGALYLCTLWRRPARQPPAPSENPPTTGIGTGDLGPFAAFTAAFVLARQLCRKHAP